MTWGWVSWGWGIRLIGPLGTSAQVTDDITLGTKVLEIDDIIAALKRCATQKRTCAEFPLIEEQVPRVFEFVEGAWFGVVFGMQRDVVAAADFCYWD